jgi:serine protease Do
MGDAVCSLQPPNGATKETTMTIATIPTRSDDTIRSDDVPRRRTPPRRRPRGTLSIALLATLGLLGAACGGGESTTASATGANSSSNAISSIDDAQEGVVQIVAQGSLRDPEVGFADAAGSGSGFLVSPDGLVVTNNHVVTGAATLEVFVGGDTTTSYNATVVGVSECNDLALIDIDGPKDLSYFEWYDGEISAGLDIYAAGFPLGDPEFTLTKGIVAKAKAGGDLTGTSSIDHTVEHDANIQPGNSGGPLLTADGKVAGVNYAGGATETTTAQFYAIASDLAEGVVDHLKDGDVESLGINGWAVHDADADIDGIWVAGVAPGSPAAKSGVLPGDIIGTMNGLTVGTDGTFKDYCDVIRTAGTRPIAIEVLRWDSSEVLAGEINGDKPLEAAFSFAEEIGDEVADGGESYTEYVSVTDDTGVLTVEVPAEWADVDTTPGADDEGGSIPYIAASTDLDGFMNTWATPGMQFGALPASFGSVEDVLATFAPGEDCTDQGVVDYDDGAFAGSYQLWEDCGGSGAAYVVLATTPSTGDPFVFVTIVQAVTEADLEALDHIFGTFNVT